MDMTIVKFMLSHILVAMVGVYLLKDLGLTELLFKPTVLGGVILGGIIFGIGWGFLGYCPGTSVAALAEGRWDALWGIIGMLLGGAIYAEVFPFMRETVLTWGNYGYITIPQMLGVNHWLIIPLFVIGGLALFRWFEKKGL
jgi:uncharacterized membrane protein YedE/YeeE